MDTGSLLPLIDAGLRGGALALLLLLSLVFLRQARRSPAALYGGLLCLGVAAYVFNSWPGARALHASAWFVPVAILSMGVPALFLLHARANFDDDFGPSWRDALPWLATVALGLLCAIAHLRLACRVFPVVELLWIALAIRVALVGRPADLLEERRRYRLVLVVAGASYSAAIILLESGLGGPVLAAPLGTAAAGLFVLLLAFALWSLSPAGGRFSPAAAARRIAVPETTEPMAEEPALLARLRQVMEADRAYREPGLASAGLAARLEVPEYRLRRLINQRLGHRNFSSFVNGYRLAEAFAALADPAQAEVPVITIALDAGFQSLGPFNRAFKARTGTTPSDYRRQRLEQAEGGRPGSPISEIGKPIPG